MHMRRQGLIHVRLRPSFERRVQEEASTFENLKYRHYLPSRWEDDNTFLRRFRMIGSIYAPHLNPAILSRATTSLTVFHDER
jgi:hypothetical protein